MKRTRLVVVLAAAFAAQVSAHTDLDIPEIKAYSTKLEAIRNSWQQEAETMKTVDIYKELERLDSAWAARMALHPESW